MTKLTLNFLSGGLALAALFVASPASADALPPAGEDCTGASAVPVGGACSLHDSANTPGTCQSTTCTHTPNPTFCDAGGMGENCGPVSQPCVLCIAGNAGTDGGPAAGDGGTGTADGGTTGKSSSSGGCAVTGSDSSPFNILLPLGLAALVPLALRRKARKDGKDGDRP